MPDIRPAFASASAAFGLPATVTLPGEAPVPTTAIWLSPISVDTSGVLVPTDRPQRLLAIPAAAFGVLPRGTRIDVAESSGGPVLAWTVEAAQYVASDEIRVVVLPADLP
jgi:hypothetical protein